MSSEDREFREWEGFAKKLAGRYATPGIEVEDLEQEALLALLEELPKYTPDLGVSLRVFLGRGIRNRLSFLYRKTLNLVQVDQYWLVKHVSGNRDLHVQAKSKAKAEAIIKARSDEYTAVENVKLLATLGPSLDEELDDEQGCTLHETLGQGPLQELSLLASEGEKKVRQVNRKGDRLAEIFKRRSEGHTFQQIADDLGMGLKGVFAAFSRAQKRLSKSRAA